MSGPRFFDGLIPATEPNDAKIFWTSVAYSLFHVGVMWHAYLTGHHAPPYSLIVIHTIFVGVLYALPKEYERWKNHKDAPAPNRPGHLLVIAWLASHAVMAIGAYATKGRYGLPEGMTDMTAILLGTFGATYLSKRMHLNKRRCPPEAAGPQETEKPPQ
jgi:hypothetical protein